MLIIYSALILDVTSLGYALHLLQICFAESSNLPQSMSYSLLHSSSIQLENKCMCTCYVVCFFLSGHAQLICGVITSLRGGPSLLAQQPSPPRSLLPAMGPDKTAHKAA